MSDILDAVGFFLSDQIIDFDNNLPRDRIYYLLTGDSAVNSS